MAHHKTYVPNTSKTWSQTPSPTFTFPFGPNYGVSVLTGTRRGNQVTSVSDAHNYMHYYASPHYGKIQVCHGPAASRAQTQAGRSSPLSAHLHTAVSRMAAQRLRANSPRLWRNGSAATRSGQMHYAGPICSQHRPAY